MSSIELIASLLGIINIVLIIRRSVWNYPFGIVMVALFGWVVWQQKLYSDAALQIFFIIVQLYGWWSWSRNQSDEGEIIVKRLSRPQIWMWLTASVAAAALWGAFLLRYTDASLPYLDSPIAMFSVAAQILMTRRYIDNWHWWIAVNLISIPTYASKGLYAFAILYAINLILAIKGLIDWRAAERAQSSSAAHQTAAEAIA